jgi:hypothetical protein
MALLLLIVSRMEPSRFAYLTHVFANETVSVILDRRVEERRQPRFGERAAAERRHEDRRQRDISEDLRTHGWALLVRRRP